MSGDKNNMCYENNINYKAVTCEQIPELFLDKIVAKNHFSKFGKIKRFILRPKHLSCTVEYENQDDANNAFMNAGDFNGLHFVVGYATHEVAHIQNTEEWVDPEVQAELEAMSPGHVLHTALRSSVLSKSSGMSRSFKPTNNLSFSPKHIKLATTSKQNSPQPEMKIDSVARQELEDILKTPAFTAEEKYRVLDARDKLYRLTTVRQTDIKKAVSIKGTCPDMCPEKERLMREFQRQISIFEMADDENNDTIISHKKAVKEYSRSSADQEVPLAHELRSEYVLQMTMLYLVHNIMGLCEDPKTSLCEWFHFVWDRTRSIRKDITQQELCSVGAVQLVEQCARFHIHCAARLVAEDPSVFDKKINAENLTKCLQTLKYMYHDLRIKGIVCPSEAEFRSYVILLNLGDSNFLWEVKQLPETIQKSVEIKRAIAFYNVLQNNNFVKFFSMIKSPDTTYLSSCILLGYFTKLRVRAMDAIVKSHNWRKNDVYLPLSYLTGILGFDDECSAISFFNHYGLHYELTDKRVLLDRLSKPNMEYAMDRVLQLVESKRTASVGECIFGQKLHTTFSFENHQPQNSFDNNGLFKIELLAGYYTTEGFSKSKLIRKHQQKQADTNLVLNDLNLFKTPQTFPVCFPKQQKKILHEKHNIVKEIQETCLDIKREDKTLSLDRSKFCDSIISGTANAKAGKESLLNSPYNMKSEQFPSNYLQIESAEKSVQNNIFGIAVRETANLFRKQNYKNDIGKENPLPAIPQISELKYFPHISNKADLTACDRNTEQNPEINTQSMIAGNNEKENGKEINEKKLTILELNEVKEIQKKEDVNENKIMQLKKNCEEKAALANELFILHIIENEICTLAKCELLLFQSTEEAAELQSESIIAEVVKELVADIANEEYAFRCYGQLLLNRYFNMWLMHLRRKKEKRKFMESTPLWATTYTRSQYAQEVKHPCQEENLQMIKRYRFGKPYDLNKYFKTECAETENVINLFALVGQHLLTKRSLTLCGTLQQRKYFKFIITVPANEEELLGFENFLSECLNRIIESGQTKSSSFIHGIEHDVGLCVRKFTGIIPKNEQGNEMTREGDHNDGVLCFISGIAVDTHSRKRLYNLLKLTKNLKRIPLAIIAYNCKCDEEELAELLGLDDLQEEGLIYSYIILGCKTKRTEFNLRKLIVYAVNFIANESILLNSNEIQALAMQKILPFLEISLGEDMWLRWCASAKSNPIFNKICNFPDHVLNIYHKALDHLLHITQEDFIEMPEFPQELKEFVPDSLSSDAPLGLEYFPANWKDETDKKLIKNIIQSLYLPAMERNPSDINDLKTWIFNYTSKCLKDDDLAVAKASHEAITNLVNQIKFLQIGNLNSSKGLINYLSILKPIVFAHINRMLINFEKELINLKVIYLKDEFKNYQTQPWWLNYEHLNKVSVDYNEVPLCLSKTAQPQRANQITSDDEINKIVAKAEETSRKVDDTILEYKKRKCVSYSNSFRNLATPQISRILDNSIYHFELLKKVGRYNTSYAMNLTNSIDESISKVLQQSPISKKKRHKESLNDNNAVAQATKLIRNMESIDDKKLRRKMYYNYNSM